MKNVIVMLASAVSACSLSAAPEIDSMRQSLTGDGVARVGYTLSGEPGVVTFSATYGDGTPVADSDMSNVSGQVNCLVHPGVSSSFSWKLPDSIVSVAKDVTVTLRVWATNCPPNYMVVCLTNVNNAVRYYTSIDRLPIPFGDMAYKTTHLVMSKIPAAGVVWRMGSPAYEVGRTSANEGTRRVVLTHDYYMGIYPVTVGQFDFVKSITGHSVGSSAALTYLADDKVCAQDAAAPDWPRGQLSYGNLRGTSATADGKSWDQKTPYWPNSGHEAIDSNSVLGLMRTKWGVSFDLPSEAEWEFACRGGNSTAYYTGVDPNGPEGTSYLTNMAWMAINTSGAGTQGTVYKPHGVGQLKPNAFGLYDMLGGIWEYCADWQAPIVASDALAIDPMGPANYSETADPNRAFSCGYRVLRGGSYATSASSCRAAAQSRQAARFDAGTAPSKYSLGFRLWAPAMTEK